jgi:hypothetical protein
VDDLIIIIIIIIIIIHDKMPVSQLRYIIVVRQEGSGAKTS